jgi:dUTP pyrophosphatase
MRIRIIRVEKDLPLPAYQTEGAVAFDMYSRVDAVLQPKELKILPSNLIIEVPKGYCLVLRPRSSTPRRKGLVLRGSNLIDQDFHGPNDEIGLALYNFTEKPAEVKRGERIAQGMIVPIERADWEEVEQIKDSSRGGFGSTG